MNTELKSIRFPKILVETLEKYSKEKYGLTFSKFLIHMAIERMDSINKEQNADLNLINSFLDAEDDIKSGKAMLLRDKNAVKTLLDEWKQGE